jgi:hypothetical protein
VALFWSAPFRITMLLAPAIVALHAAALPFQSCKAAPPTAPTLDHAIVVVDDLDSASNRFRRSGFRIKQGRPHANGLLNRHIKFRDRTEVELMTVRGTPRDDIARDYAKLMRAGDGGVYVALQVKDLNTVARHASTMGARVQRPSSGPWSFVSFTDTSSLAAVFFGNGGGGVLDPDSIFQHRPPVEALEEAWVEGGPALAELLRRLGAAECGTATGPGGISGQRFALRRGSIVVMATRSNARPRVLGVVLDTPSRPATTVRPIPEFWIHYR